MDQSILTSIKKMLGIHEEVTDFDIDIVIHINTVFSLLYQIGASPLESVRISDKTATWAMLLGDVEGMDMIKTYTYLKVRSFFDPPTSQILVTAQKEQIQEFEWRLNVSEIKFNPYTYTGIDFANVYIIDDLGDFPPEAPIGALGFDPDSGKIWKNT